MKNHNKKLKILFIGRLEKDIGIDIYLGALRMLKQKGIAYEVSFLGDGSYKSEVLRFGRVVSHSNDTYHRSEILRNTDFVFASSYLSILESFVAKRLVFAVYENSLKEDYLKMTPFAKWIALVDSAEDLVAKMLYFRKHLKEERKLVERAYQWVIEQTWDKVSNIYITLWHV